MRIQPLLIKPLIYFYMIWSIFLFLRFLPIIQWNNLHIGSIVYLSLMMINIFLSYMLGILIIKKILSKSNKNQTKIVLKNFKKIYIFFFIFSLISILLIFIKFYTQINMFNLGMSIGSVTELRYERMHQAEQNQTMTGVIGTMLSGFAVILYFISYWYKDNIPKIYFNVSVVMLILYSLAMMTSGGRNAIFITVLLLFTTTVYKKIYYGERKKSSFGKQIKYFLIAGLVLKIFYAIFVDRAARYGFGFIERTTETAYWYNIKFNDFLVGLLDNEYINGFVFLFLSLFFYLEHSLDQFDIAFNGSVSNNFPYLGAVNFYPIVQLLNKFGLGLISIDQINRELPNPGNYTTLFAPLYFDFGIFGSFLFISLIVFIFVYNYISFLNRGSIVNFILVALLTLVFMVSPIYSFFALSVASPIFFALFIFIVLNIFIKIERRISTK